MADPDDKDMLSKAKQEDIADLAVSDPMDGKSKWEIYKELPGNKKWGYFYRHFFWPIIIGVVIVALVVVFIVNAIISPKGQGLGVAYLEMKETSQQMDDLQNGFIEHSKVNKKLVGMENQFYPDSNNNMAALGSKATLETQVSGGTINTLIGPRDAIEQQNKNGFVEPLKYVLNENELKKLQDMGAVVDLHYAKDKKDMPMALDLSKSTVWTSIHGDDQNALVSFVNVSDMQYVHDFVRYLYGL